MSKKKDDGLVIWEEQKGLSFLPQDIENDQLSALLRHLIAKVKEDHARFQYRKELKNYILEIVQIMNCAKKNGYKITECKNETLENNEEYNGDIDLNNIVDG